MITVSLQGERSNLRPGESFQRTFSLGDFFPALLKFENRSDQKQTLSPLVNVGLSLYTAGHKYQFEESLFRYDGGPYWPAPRFAPPFQSLTQFIAFVDGFRAPVAAQGSNQLHRIQVTIAADLHVAAAVTQ